MTITKLPLLLSEKQVLRRAFKIRIIIGILFLLPLLAVIGWITTIAVSDFLKNRFEAMDFIPVLLAPFTLALCYKFVIPFYRKSYNNLFVTDKLVVKTKILALRSEVRPQGIRFVVETEYRTIDSWGVTVYRRDLLFPEMETGMTITLHCLNNNQFDLLCITR